MWCIFPVENENLVLGSHIHVRTSSRQIGTETWDKRQANRQANRQALTAYPFPPQSGTYFDWGSSCTHGPSGCNPTHSLSPRPHWDVASGIHISILIVLYNSCRIVTNQCMYELLTSPSVVNGTVITHSCIPDFL